MPLFSRSKKSKKTKKSQAMMPWKVTNKYVPPATGPFSAASRRAFDLERVRHKAAMRTIASLGGKWRAKKAANQKWANSWSRGMNRSTRKRYK